MKGTVEQALVTFFRVGIYRLKSTVSIASKDRPHVPIAVIVTSDK